MSTILFTAGSIMDRVARLLNDPNRTDYTYSVQIPYLNMAIEEFSDMLAESNSPFTNLNQRNMTGVPIIIPKGTRFLVPPDYVELNPAYEGLPTYPPDLIEIQEIGERHVGSTGPYRFLQRKEFGEYYPQTDSLMYWIWERGIVIFSQNGANVDIEIELKFIYQGLPYVVDETSKLYMIGARSFLSYRTAGLCAMFIGENETRAGVLENEAMKAAERAINISTKGRQQIMTRHRPFRAAYKARGGF